jgi:hypothetical protein
MRKENKQKHPVFQVEKLSKEGFLNKIEVARNRR